MVGIISSSGLGLFDSSMDRLGTSHGNPTNLGQAKGSAYVNIATGNLSVQFLDESLSGAGADLSALRTYNSQGGYVDGDADGWRWNGEKKVILTGTANTASAVVTRTTGDGTHSIFKWDGVANSNRYTSTTGSSAHDSITWNSGASEWVYNQDGSSELVERYSGSSGWIKSLRDNSGNGFDYTFTGNLLTKIKDLGSGQTLEFGYTNNKLNQVSTRTTATGALTKQVYYSYNTSGRLESVKTDLTPSDNSISDNNVYTTTYGYDANGLLNSISQSDGTSVSFKHELVNGGYRVTEVNDQTGKTTFAYDISSRTTIVKNGNGDNWAYTYNALGELVSHTSSFNNGVGQKASYTYDSQGNVKTIVDGRGKTITYDYDGSGNRIKEYDSLGNTITRTFGAGNLLLTETKYSVASTTSPSGAETTRYVYDTAGRVRFVISPEGRASEIRYNSLGLTSHTVQYTTVKYTAASVLLADLQTWANTNKTNTQITEFQYDYRGNLSKKTEFANINSSGVGVVDSAATITEFTYSEHGQLIQTIAVRGTNRDQRTTLSSYGYDGMGRQLTAINDNVTTTTSYSGINITVTNTATGLITTSTTDSLGRLISLTQSDSSTNRITKYYYDNTGQLRMTEEPTSARSYLFYDHAGRVSAKVDAAGAATVYTRDNDGRVLTETRYANPTNSSGWFNGTAVTEGGLSIGTSDTNIIIDSANDRKTTYTYDDAGRLKTKIEAWEEPVKYFYDGASRLIRTEQGDRITRYFYDKDGKKIGVLDAERYLTQYVYDSVGRLTLTVRYGAIQATTAQQSSASFDSIRTTVNNGARLTTYYFYDAQGRQTGVVDEQGFLTVTNYDAVANRRETYRYATPVTVAESNSFEILETLSAVKSRAGASYWVNTNYDIYGRVDTVTQQNGTVSRNVYDNAGRLARQIDGEGDADWRITHTRFNAFNEVTGVVTGDAALNLTVNTDSASVNAVNTAIASNGTRYDIDGAGRKVAEYGANGQKTFLFYNAAGQLTYTMNALGEVSKSSYNAFGQISEVRVFQNRLAAADLALFTTGGLDTLISAKALTNSNDKVVTNTYNQMGGIATQTDAEGYTTTYYYSLFGELGYLRNTISKSPSSTVVTQYGRDKLGREIWKKADSEWLNITTSQTIYDGFGRIKSAIDANGNTTDSVYQFNGRVVEITDPLGRKSKTEIDFQGRTLKSTDALGNVTSYSYDDADRKFTITHADGTSITTWKTGRGETLKVQDANGGITQYTYNKDGKLKTVTNALGQISTDNTYDNSGRLYESKDANGTVTRYNYDAANRITYKTIDPNGLNIQTRYQFDGQGRQVYVTTANGKDEASVTQYVYNRNDQIKQIIVDPNGLRLTTTFTYDGVGQTTRVDKGTNTATAEQTTIYDYDKLGRKTSERVDPNGLNITTQYAYDNNGNLIKKTDANGNVTQFAYNIANQLRYTITAEGTVSENIYDLNGNITRTIVYQTPKTTGTNTFADVDAFANPKRSDALNQNTYFAYNNNNRLRFTVNAEGAVSEKVYDANGNVISTINFATSKTTDSNTLSDLDAFSVANLSNGSNQIANFVYDKINRLRYSINAEGAVSENIYDANGNIVRTVDYATKLSANEITSLNLALSTGKNNIINSTFSNPTNGAPAGWSYGAYRYAASIYGVNLNSDWTLQGQVVGDNTLYLQQSGRDPVDAYQEFSQVVQSVIPGMRYIFSAYTGAHRASVTTQIAWVDANGNFIGEATAGRNDAEQSGGQSLAGYKRISANGIAPSGAVKAVLFIRKYNTNIGAADSWMFATHAQLETLPADIATPSSWAPDRLDWMKSLFLSKSSANDHATNFTYDKANRLRFTVSADGSVSESEHDANGNVTKTTQFAVSPTTLTGDYSFANINSKINRADTNNRSTWFVFDKANRLVYTVNALGAVSENIYDSLGNVTSTVQYSTLINPVFATSIFSVDMALNSWTQTFASNASGISLPATNFSVANGQLVMSSVKTAAGTASTFPQAWGTARAVGTSFSYEFLTDGATNSHYGTIGINSTDWKRRHAISQNGGTFYAEYVDGNGVVQSRSLGTIKDNTKYILEIETDAQGSTLYLYEATQTRKSALVDRRNYADWKDVSTWLLTGNVAGFTNSSTIYLETIKESLPALDVRKTNFTYDKANRLKLTINAEGAITENIYDANGNVIRTVAYSGTSSKSNLILIQGTVQESSGTQTISSAETLDIQTTKTSASATRVGRLTVTGELWVTQGTTDYKIADNVSEFQLLNNKIAFIKNGNLYAYDNATINTTTINGLAATATGVISFQLEGTRIGYLNNKNEFWVQDPAVSSAWTNQYSNVKAFQMEGNRIGVLLNNGQLRVKEGDLYAGWWVLYENVTQFQLEGTRVGVLTNGSLLVKEGALNAGWSTLYNNVSNFQLEGNRVAILTNHTLMVKEGALNAGWYTLSQNVSSVNLVGSRLAAITSDGTLYFKEVLSAGWSLVRSNVQSVAMTADLFAYTEGAADRTTHYAYDKANRLRFTVNANNYVTENTYDSFGNVKTLTQFGTALTATSNFSESNINTLVTRSATIDRTTSYDYDKLNRQRKTTLAGWYDVSSGRVYGGQTEVDSTDAPYASDTTNDRFQRTIEVTYDTFGNAITNKIRTGQSDYIYQHKTYDKLNREVFDIDGLGFVSKKIYNSFGDVREQVRYNGNIGVKPQGYWTSSEIETHAALTNDTKRTIISTHDKMGRVERINQGAGGSYADTLYAYNSFGELIKTTQPLTAAANAYSYLYYDKLGRQTWSVDAMGYGTKTEYNSFGDAIKTTEYAQAYNNFTAANHATLSVLSAPAFTSNVKDRISESTYNLLGQLKTTRKAYNSYGATSSTLQTTATMDYNTFGELEKSWDVSNNLTQMSYNKLGQMTTLVEPQRQVVGTGTDAFKTPVTTSPQTVIDYDAFGQRTRETRSSLGGAATGATQISTHKYDLAGNEIKTTDAMNNVSYAAYDVSGKVIRQQLAISVTGTTTETNYTYTLDRRFEYDAAGRQIATVDIYDNQTKMTGQHSKYNAYGEVTEERKIWGSYVAGNSAGIATNYYATTAAQNVMVNDYRYDNMGRMTYKHGADGYSYYYYNLAGYLTDSSVHETETEAASYTDRSTTYHRDALGRLTIQENPLFNVSSGFGLTTTNSLAVRPTINREYDRWGNVTREYGDTVEKSYTYNQDNAVLSEEGGYEYMINYAGSAPAAKMRKEFTYNANNQLLTELQRSILGAGGETTRTVVSNQYNATGQLIKTQAGEQLKRSNQQGTFIGQEFAYDVHGNRVGTKDAFGHVWVDVFNANNQIVEHNLLRNGATGEYTGSQTTTPTKIKLASYLYDQAGRKYGQGDNTGYTQYTKFDERGNVLSSRVSDQGYRRYEYDYLNNKTKDTSVSIEQQFVGYLNGDYGSPIYNDVTTTLTLHTWNYFEGTTTDYKDYASNKIQAHYIGDTTGEKYEFSYTNFGELEYERRASNRNNDYVKYEYASNGLLAKVKEYKLETVSYPYQTTYNKTTSNETSYLYDVRGNKVAEISTQSFVQGSYTVTPPTSGGSYSSSAINYGGTLRTYYQYDSLNRLKTVKSDRSPFTTETGTNYSVDLQSLNYGYDEWGNRRYISSTFKREIDANVQTKTEWYSYDLDDRVLVEGGVVAGGVAVANKSQGIVYSYDNMGRRQTQENFLGNASWWSTSGGAGGLYAEDYKRTAFSYGDLGLVKQSIESVVRRDLNSNTNMGSQASSITTNYHNQGLDTTKYGNLINETSEYDNRGFKKVVYSNTAGGAYTTNASNGKKLIYTYNNSGSMLTQLTYRQSDNFLETRITNTYDTDNNLKDYKYQTYSGSSTTTNTYVYDYVNTYTGRQVEKITVTSSQNNTGQGTTFNTYDMRGRLIRAYINEVHVTNPNQTGYGSRYFTYNTSGQIIFKAEKRYGETTFKTQNFYYAPSGGELASLGQQKIDISPLSAVYDGGNTPGSYTVNAGDSLMSIAQSLFGDANLWYVIADANGLSMLPTDAFSNMDAGRNLRIPNNDQSVSNTSTNWKPYNPTEMIGDLTPSVTILPPPKAKGCSAFAIVLMVVVAVVVTIYTAGAAASYFAGQTIAGTTALVGGGIGASATVVASSVAGSVIGGFVGSVASQAVGMAMGVQDRINFRQAAGSGLTAGFAAGAGAYLQAAGNTWAVAEKAKDVNGVLVASKYSAQGYAAMGALSYAGAYASNKIVGLETHFNWTDMAVATVSSGITGKTGNGVTDALHGEGGIYGNFIGNMWGSTVSSSLSRLAGRGEKQDWGTMAADAFGNALATKVVQLASTPPKWQQDLDASTARVVAGGNRQLAQLGANQNAQLTGQIAANSAAMLDQYDTPAEIIYASAANASEAADNAKMARNLVAQQNYQSQSAALFNKLDGYQQQLAGHQQDIADTWSRYNASNRAYYEDAVRISSIKSNETLQLESYSAYRAPQIADFNSIYGAPSGSTLGQTSDVATTLAGGFTRFASDSLGDLINVGQLMSVTGQISLLSGNGLWGESYKSSVNGFVSSFGPGMFTGGFGNETLANAIGISTVFMGLGASRGGVSIVERASAGIPSRVATNSADSLALFANKFPEHPTGIPTLISDSKLANGRGVYNYVVMEDGQLVIGRQFNDLGGGHIDLANGAPVTAAGEVKILNGEIKYIDNTSGHYEPFGASAQKAAENAFSLKGFNVADKYVEKVWVNDLTSPRGGAWKVK